MKTDEKYYDLRIKNFNVKGLYEKLYQELKNFLSNSLVLLLVFTLLDMILRFLSEIQICICGTNKVKMNKRRITTLLLRQL